MSSKLATRPSFNGDVLTIGFAATIAMWGVGYFLHIPAEPAPASQPPVEPVSGWLVFCLLVVVMYLGGIAAGLLTGRSWKGGMWCGMVAGLLNLLALGSVMGDLKDAGFANSAALWAPGSIMLAMVIGAAGALTVAARPRNGQRTFSWPAAFALTAAVATLLLLSVGGMVTGYEAGLSVPDWPNTEGHNMFLYPRSKMVGGIFFEHAHRLLGSLVGLTTVVLAVYVHRVDQRKWLRRLSLVAVAMVVAQGIMGGLRVTGGLTLSTAREDMAPSIALAIVHGVFGQLFLTTLVAISVFLSTSWSRGGVGLKRFSVETDRRIGMLTIGLIVGQLIAGALVRHVSWGVTLHVSLAALVLSAVCVFAARAWGLYGKEPILRRTGMGILIGAAVQLLLGIAALVAVMLEEGAQRPGNVQVLITTLHQTVGALLLAASAALLLWEWRLLEPEREYEPVAKPA